MIENTQLVDRLAKEVANAERRRISRDLHDSTIQPYIGLKLGLEALRRKFKSDDALGREVTDLVRMAGDAIIELRSYVGQLKSGAQRRDDVALLPGVRQQAQKFSDFYGINANVVADRDIFVKGPMFDEVMQIVREGLSNVRRHTSAEKATINMAAHDGHLLLEFVNDDARRHNGAPDFFPRSIGERAEELGGRVRVEARQGGYTAVAVDIPL